MKSRPGMKINALLTLDKERIERIMIAGRKVSIKVLLEDLHALFVFCFRSTFSDRALSPGGITIQVAYWGDESIHMEDTSLRFELIEPGKNEDDGRLENLLHELETWFGEREQLLGKSEVVWHRSTGGARRLYS